MKCRVFDIDWDVSDPEFPDSTPEQLGLPSEFEMDVPDDDVDDAEYYIDKEIESYGFCHFGYRFEWKKNKKN